MRQTSMANESNVERKWYVIDAEGRTLGRLSSEAVSILYGKSKVIYTPHAGTDGYVIVISTLKIKFTGNEETDKVYYHHPNHPDGIKSITTDKLRRTNPGRLIENSIKGILSSTRLGEEQGKKLSVYGDAEHPHTAQQPENYELCG